MDSLFEQLLNMRSVVVDNLIWNDDLDHSLISIWEDIQLQLSGECYPLQERQLIEDLGSM